MYFWHLRLAEGLQQPLSAYRPPYRDSLAGASGGRRKPGCLFE
jgi:hypothetical protein